MDKTGSIILLGLNRGPNSGIVAAGKLYAWYTNDGRSGVSTVTHESTHQLLLNTGAAAIVSSTTGFTAL